MKNYFTAITLFFCLVIQAQNGQKLGLRFTVFLDQNPKIESSNSLKSLLVKGNPAQIKQLVKKHLGVFKFNEGNISSIAIPYNQLRAFADNEEIQQIEQPFSAGHILMDSARIKNNVDSAQKGIYPLEKAYSGKNVVIGIIDLGIHFRHKDFRDSSGATRIKYLWDHASSAGTSPSPYGYGSEWTSAQIDAGTCSHKTTLADNGHGTTVAGIAAGNGLSFMGNPSLDKKYVGVAPKADIIYVKYDPNGADFLGEMADAINYIYTKAQAMGKPCVINTSEGTYFGSHDAKDVSTQLIENMITAQNGRSLVAAAGNAGNVNFHLSYNLSPTDSLFTWFKYYSAIGGVYFDFWADTANFTNSATFAIGCDNSSPTFLGRTKYYKLPADFNPNATGTLLLDTVRNSGGTALGYLQLQTTLEGGTYHFEAFITPTNTTYNWRLQTKGTGKFDLWASKSLIGSSDMFASPLPGGFTSPNYRFGDSLQTIVSAWQCSDKVITVGNYNARANYTDVNSVVQNAITAPDVLGGKANTSSIGPTRDGRIKPDIAATGSTTVASGDSVFIAGLMGSGQSFKVGLGGLHNRNGGTSMASPEVSGTIALLFEKNPSASWSDIKRIITSTASKDGFTTNSVPNVKFGAGKLNAYQALLEMNRFTWVGGTSTDWNNTANWSPNGLPNSCSSDVKIPAGTSFSPTLSSADITVGKMDIADGVGITLNGKNLSICKDWVGGNTTKANTLGTGRIILNGSSLQTIKNKTQFEELEINNTAGVLNIGDVLIHKILHPTTGTLTNTGNWTFLSTAAYQSATIDFTAGNNGNIVGNIQAQRFIPVAGSNQHLISSPIDSSPISQLNVSGSAGFVTNSTCDETQSSVGSPYGTLFRFQEPHGNICGLLGWESIISGDLENARGYSAYLTGNTTTTLTGIANQAANYTLGNITNSNWATNTTLQGRTLSAGFNLVGNPYLSSINLATKSGLDAQVSVWQTSGPFAGTFQTLFMGSNAVIAPFQGFYVHKTTPGSTTFSVSKSECVNPASSPTFYKTQNTSELLINVAGNGFQDQTVIGFNADASPAFDAEMDADKFHSQLGQPTLYTNVNARNLSYNYLKDITEASAIPLSFEPGQDGNFIINFNSTIPFESSTQILLEDKKLNLPWQNILSNPQYNFSALKKDNWNRFVLHFKTDKTNGINTFSDFQEKIFNTSSGIQLTHLSPEETYQISIVNLLGQVIYANTIFGQVENIIPLNNIAKQIAIVNLTSSKNNFSKKMVVGNL